MDRLRKVPVIMQMEAVECGAASLGMILSYYGKWLPLEQLRTDCGVSRDGCNALNIVKAAKHYGLAAKGFRMDAENLRNIKKPAILHWGFNHFVVLCSIHKNQVIINDPGRGRVKLPFSELDREFTGIVLTFEKTDSFQKGGKPASIYSFVKHRLAPAREIFLYLMLSGVLSAVVSIAMPILSQVFSDNIITGKNPEWLHGFLIIFAFLILYQFVLNWMDGYKINRSRARLSVIANSEFMWHVLRLPVQFFSQRYIGDLVQRQMTNESIPMILVQDLAPIMVNVMLLVIYLFFMIKYSLILTIIAIASALLNLWCMKVIASRQTDLNRIAVKDNGKLYGITMSSLKNIESIKSAGAEDAFFQRWSGFYSTMLHSRIISDRIDIHTGMIPSLIAGLTNVIILILGSYLILTGHLTIGMLLAFQGFMSSFTTPMHSLTETFSNLLTMRTQMERIEDVYRSKCDIPSFEEPQEDNGIGKLSGVVELKNVTFGYQPLSDPLIRDFSLKLEPGKSVAFVGPSGCGKSTISKLVSGLYEPWSGEILFDGKRKSEISHSVFVNSVAVIDQDITLFEGTIADNIKLWDQSIEDFAMIMASNDAQIHEEIASRPLGYDSHLQDGGSNFSGGQRQRLEIASALAKDPVILILDEATSALDADTEEKVIQAIKMAGVSLIIIAHRLSTIRDCDEIIVMQKGNIIERGTHDELIELQGYYKQLMDNI